MVLRGLRRPGSGPAVSFLSGNGFCAGVYLSLLRRLPADWDLFALDAPGQGRSDDPPEYEGGRALLSRLAAAFDLLIGGRPRIGIGHSFGAVITSRLAGTAPQRFRHVVLLDPVMFPTWMFHGLRFSARIGRHPFANAARRRRAQWPDRDAAREYLRDRGIYRGWRPEALGDFCDHALTDGNGGVRLACPPALEAEIFARPLGGYWQALRSIDCPADLYYGRDSYPIMPGIARRAQRLAPRLSAHVVPGGHCFMLEHPADTAAAIAGSVAAA